MSKTLVVKFLKYALIVAVADTLPVFLGYLSNASGLSAVDWYGCLDASGLVFVKALIGGGIGSLVNVNAARKAAAG